MAEEEKSAGSGFGKLVYGTLKGNGINTDDLSFDEAVKKFNELGGTDNWHAKILRKEAEENKTKTESSQKETKRETPDLDEWYEEGEINERQKARIEKYAKRFEEHPDNIIASMREYVDKGYQIDDALEESLDDLVAESGYFERKQESKPGENDKINAKATADSIAKNPNSSDFEKNLYEGVKKDINKESTEPKVEDYTEQLQKLSKEQNVDMKYIQEDLQTRLDEGQNPEEALKEIENNLKNAKPESLKEKVSRKLKDFMNKAKKGEIKPENNAPKEFKWNEKTNSYEYRGLSVMESPTNEGYYEISYGGDDILSSDLNSAKKTIDQLMDREESLGSAEKLEADDIKKKEELEKKKYYSPDAGVEKPQSINYWKKYYEENIDKDDNGWHTFEDWWEDMTTKSKLIYEKK